MTTVCKKCHVEKPIEEFEVTNPVHGWRRHECKSCTKRRVKDWRVKSVDHIRATRGKYRQADIERASRWNIDHADKHRTHCLDHYYKLQDMVIMAYGGYRCACCGEAEPLFLSIDHVNNDGKEHRKGLRGMRIYKWLIDNHFPPGFQVLCMNCNHGKHRNHGLCPHKGLSSGFSPTPP